MARIRTIKPEFQNSQSMGRVSRDARLTFVQMWPQCDDAGRIRANSRMLASVLFPYDEDAPKLIDGWLDELEKEGCLVRYRVGSDEYIAICHWDHQKIDHPQPSKLPAPPEKKTKKTKQIVREHSRVPDEPSEIVRAVSSTVSSTVSDSIRGARASRFAEFWDACPLKVGKGAAETLFTKACKSGADPELMIAAMRGYAREQQGTEKKFIAHPRTWLFQRRWEDEGAAKPSAVTAFNSPEELAFQARMKEQAYGKAPN